MSERASECDHLNKDNCVKEISFNYWAEKIVVYQGQIKDEAVQCQVNQPKRTTNKLID